MSLYYPTTADGKTIEVVLIPALIDPLKDWLAARNGRLVLMEAESPDNLSAYVVTPIDGFTDLTVTP